MFNFSILSKALRLFSVILYGFLRVHRLLGFVNGNLFVLNVRQDPFNLIDENIVTPIIAFSHFGVSASRDYFNLQPGNLYTKSCSFSVLLRFVFSEFPIVHSLPFVAFGYELHYLAV